MSYESTLLIVEGKEDVAFFEALARHLDKKTLTIRGIRGKNRLPQELRTLSKEQLFLDQVTSVGIIRDADQSSRSTFQSVCSALGNAGLPVPRQPLKSADGTPRVTVMIMPTNKKSGILEDVCLESLGNTATTRCVDDYFQCLDKDYPPHVLSKARLQVYLASLEPELRLGEAAQKGYWNWDNPAFDQIKEFLQQIVT